MLQLVITILAGTSGYLFARSFVSRRLRFVDAIHSPMAPLIAGIFAAAIAWPASILPFVTLTTALVFGIGTGLGTASGSRAVRHAASGRRQLTP